MKPEEQFSRNAEDYRHEPLFAEGDDLRWMVDAQPLHGSEDLLDVGCGAGHTALAFAPFVRNCVGVDVTEAMVRVAAALRADRGRQNVSFQVGAAEALPFPSGAFDLVTCRFAAHHFADVRAALAEVARVLRPRGAFLLVDHVAPEDEALDAFINRLDRTRDPSHVREHRLSEFRSRFVAAGLSCDVLRLWDLRLDFENWIRRARATPEAEARLVALFRTAPAPCRSTFGLELDAAGRPRAFRLHCALLHGAKA